MAKVETWQCDVCQIQKASGNHWWRVYLIDRDDNDKQVGVLIVGWEVKAISTPFVREPLPEAADAHLCGEQHVMEWLSKNLFGKS